MRASRRRRTARRRGRAPRLLLFVLALLAAPFIAVGLLTWPNRITPRGIVIHHSALGGNADGRANAAVIDAIHQRRGWGVFYAGRVYHIGYHYVIRPDGTVEPGRPERCRGAHAKGFNDRIGICVLGNFNDGAPTERQQKALVALCRDLLKRYDLRADDIRGHRDCPAAATDCPGRRFPLAALRRKLGAKPQPDGTAASRRAPGSPPPPPHPGRAA